MPGFLKTEIQHTLGHFATEASSRGWKYAKSDFKFTKQLGPGLKVVVHPRLTFTGGGLFCLSQPSMILRCKKYETLDRKLLGKGPGPLFNQGPIFTGFWLEPPVGKALTTLLKSRYIKKGPQFIEMEVPNSRFTPENGYFQSEEIDLYMEQLLLSAEGISNLFSLETEDDFIASIPRDITDKHSGEKQFLGPVVAYCIIELMKGNKGVFQEIQENPNVHVSDEDQELLDTIFEKQDQVFG